MSGTAWFFGLEGARETGELQRRRHRISETEVLNKYLFNELLFQNTNVVEKNSFT